MLGTAKHFALAAATSAAAGLVLRITSLSAFLSGAQEAPWMPLDGAHLLTAGAPLFAVGAVIVAAVPSLVPDEKLRKGPAPRAFWVLVVGVGITAWAGPLATPKEPFFSAMALGGAFLELAALGLLGVPALRPPVSAPAAPAVVLTPPAPSGTETGLKGS